MLIRREPSATITAWPPEKGFSSGFSRFFWIDTA